MMLAKLLQDAGAPDGTLNIIHGQHDAVNFICNQAGEYICKRHLRGEGGATIGQNFIEKWA